MGECCAVCASDNPVEPVACRSCGKSPHACGRSGPCCADCSTSRFDSHDPLTQDGGDPS